MMQRCDRRQFMKISATAAALAGMVDATRGEVANAGKITGVRGHKEPVAIAMWDFSWLQRHYPGGEFDDWDAVLDGLVARGYNAIRFDVFPALVAPQPDGRIVETYDFPKVDWKPAMWGNQYSTQINPRHALKEFIPRCIDRGIHLGLSTWFMGPGVEQIEGLDGFVRVWHETLSFLKENDLLHNIYYVDLLNEYPLFNGFTWLRRQMDSHVQAAVEPSEASKAHEWNAKMGNFNDENSRVTYVAFANNAIERLQAAWPELPFFFSQTCHPDADWKVMAPSRMAALDVHNWFVMNGLLANDTGYWENIHTIPANDQQFAHVQAAMMKNWAANKPALVDWMEQHIAEAAAVARQNQKPIGNTEGWGPINWMDHPALTWDLVKETGEICAGLARKHGYQFICTSNFTHPQFPRLWADMAWHQRVTGIIRG